MTATLLNGPLLGLESDTRYSVCFLTDKTAQAASVTIDAQAHNAELVAETPGGLFWRVACDMAADADGRFVPYTVSIDNHTAVDRHQRSQWTFYLPGKMEKPRFAYTSCNGFSSADIVTKTEKPYVLWEDMVREHHGEHPFSLLMMGGDQLYADEIWSAVPELKKWLALDKSERISRQFNKTMQAQVDRFYDSLYRDRWENEAMSLMLASVPSVMMWDDHDIFDGWGSYPEDMQQCAVYQGIYAIARRYFELFQIRSKANISLLDAQAEHYAFALTFRGYHVLALDNRAERTREQVMSSQQWQVINHHLDTINEGDLLVMSAVPVVYRDFSFTEASFDVTPWEEELTDDLKDHWRAREHQGERARLIMRLLQNAEKRIHNELPRTVILSGDVHLGCLGVINDTRQPTRPLRIHQLVSSGIVHPSPSRIAWLGIMAVTNDRDEYSNEDGSIRISMLQPFGSDKYIRARNYLTLEEGTDKKLWVNWRCDNSPNKPAYPLV
jgi:hypothetical protein